MMIEVVMVVVVVGMMTMIEEIIMTDHLHPDITTDQTNTRRKKWRVSSRQ